MIWRVVPSAWSGKELPTKHLKTNMLRAIIVSAALLLFIACRPEEKALRSIGPVDFSQVSIDDAFWNPVLQRHKDVTMPVCIAQITDSTFRLQNFVEAARLLEMSGGREARKDGSGADCKAGAQAEENLPQHRGYFFDDSDVYKALEGFAYSLQLHPDPALEALCDDWIAKFAAAQEADGYLDTYFTLKRPGDMWTDMDMHEMYCAGHLVEAAVAYYRATGKSSLLDVARRLVHHIMTVFGPGKRDWVPGHEEIELALVKLWAVTGDSHYADFAHWLLEERGRGLGGWRGGIFQAPYYQDAVPVKDLTSVSGHAVRAMYLYSAMADVQALRPESGYGPALDSIWEDVVLRNMYVTGGIGSTNKGEAFTDDYDLPNAEAYCETCASIGMVFWNWRMNLLKVEAKYADIVEKEIYNGLLAGISLGGDRFFYVNPLESAGTHHRKRWYGCACCPSNLCRFLPSLGGYIYGKAPGSLFVNLYIGSTLAENGRALLRQSGNYPWDGNVRVELLRSGRKALHLRIPGWCRNWTLRVNGEEVEAPVESGYAVLERRWKKGDAVDLSLDMPVELVAADPRVKADEGKRAVCRGPLVYCAEETDNPSFGRLALREGTSLSAVLLEDGPLAGLYAIDARPSAASACGSDAFRWIPYFAWDNRAPGRMKVWVDLFE